MVEFGVTFGLLMLVIVLTAQVAVYLHQRNSLQLVAKEAAFEASLAGHTDRDGELAAQRMWAVVEPGGGTLSLAVTRSGRLVAVTATAPAPLTGQANTGHSAHTVEAFEPGSQP
jgi:Flp pilus assembly protein TadG